MRGISIHESTGMICIMLVVCHGMMSWGHEVMMS